MSVVSASCDYRVNSRCSLSLSAVAPLNNLAKHVLNGNVRVGGASSTASLKLSTDGKVIGCSAVHTLFNKRAFVGAEAFWVDKRHDFVVTLGAQLRVPVPVHAPVTAAAAAGDDDEEGIKTNSRNRVWGSVGVDGSGRGHVRGSMGRWCSLSTWFQSMGWLNAAFSTPVTPHLSAAGRFRTSIISFDSAAEFGFEYSVSKTNMTWFPWLSEVGKVTELNGSIISNKNNRQDDGGGSVAGPHLKLSAKVSDTGLLSLGGTMTSVAGSHVQAAMTLPLSSFNYGFASAYSCVQAACTLGFELNLLD